MLLWREQCSLFSFAGRSVVGNTGNWYHVWRMVDGTTRSAYVSNNLGDDVNGKYFYIDLGTSVKVVGFSVYPHIINPYQSGQDYELNHIAMSISDTQDQTGNFCTELTEPAEYFTWNCYRCTEGHVIGQDLPTQVFFSHGRYVHFRFTQDANLKYLSIKELNILSII